MPPPQPPTKDNTKIIMVPNCGINKKGKLVITSKVPALQVKTPINQNKDLESIKFIRSSASFKQPILNKLNSPKAAFDKNFTRVEHNAQ